MASQTMPFILDFETDTSALPCLAITWLILSELHFITFTSMLLRGVAISWIITTNKPLFFLHPLPKNHLFSQEHRFHSDYRKAIKSRCQIQSKMRLVSDYHWGIVKSPYAISSKLCFFLLRKWLYRKKKKTMKKSNFASLKKDKGLLLFFFFLWNTYNFLAFYTFLCVLHSDDLSNSFWRQMKKKKRFENFLTYQSCLKIKYSTEWDSYELEKTKCVVALKYL